MLRFYVEWTRAALSRRGVARSLDPVGDLRATWFVLATAVLLVADLAGWIASRDDALHTSPTGGSSSARASCRGRNVPRTSTASRTSTWRQSFFDRLFGVGTLDFDTAGTEDSDFKFLGIADPDELRTRIDTEYVRRTREMPSGMS